MDSERQKLQRKCQQPMIVFQPGAPGLESYSSFRIPAIVFHKNEFLAFCEGRRKSSKDSGPIDLVVRIGQVKANGEQITVDWGDLTVLVPADNVYRAMNACPIVDKTSGHIVLVYCRFPVNQTENQLIVRKTYDQHICCIISEDNGRHWSSPISLTYVLDQMEPKPILYAPGPGHGIQITGTGRLIVSGNIQFKRRSRFPRVRSLLSKVAPFIGAVGRACLIYSDDHGRTWHALPTTRSAPYGCNRILHANESQVAEISGGYLYVNSRTRQPTRNRQSVRCSPSVDVLEDLEETTLYEPSGIPRCLSWLIPNCYVIGGCEGSILSVDHPRSTRMKKDESKVLIFSNPASKRKRQNLSLRASLDEGQTWTDPWPLHPGPSGYSDLVAFRPSTGETNNPEEGTDYLGCLYECGHVGQNSASKIVLTVVGMETLLSNVETEGIIHEKQP